MNIRELTKKLYNIYLTDFKEENIKKIIPEKYDLVESSIKRSIDIGNTDFINDVINVYFPDNQYLFTEAGRFEDVGYTVIFYVAVWCENGEIEIEHFEEEWY